MPIGIGGAIIEIIAAGINLRGNYDAAVAYAAGDAVRAPNGRIYIATAATTAGTAPPAVPWALYSGQAGAAGSSYQVVYRRTTTNAAPPLPVGDAPAGWTAAPQGVDSDNPYEWVSIRTGRTGNWSAWSAPAIAYLDSGSSGLTEVETDTTITGDGTSGDPLKVANPYTDDDEAKLDAIPNQESGNANKYLGFDGSGNYSTLDAPSGGGGGGLTSVSTDGTIDGDGTSGDPLSLADDAVTSAKLASGAVDRPALDENSVSSDAIITTGSHRAGPGIRGALEDLTTTDRLPATAVRDLGTTAFLTAPDGTGNLAATVDTVQELLNAVDGLATGSGGLNQAAVDARIYTLVAAMLTGNTETGITVTYETSDNTIDFVVTGGGGGSTPAPATRYYGVSPDTAFAVTEYTAAPTTGVITPSAPAVNSYIAFAIPNDAADLSDIRQGSLQHRNQFTAFQRIPGTITLGGVAHKAWRSNQIQFPATIGANWYIS